MKIVVAGNNTLIEKDTVYLPPPAVYTTIKNDHLYVQKRIAKTLFPNWIIYVFYNSLAEAKCKKSIAVILSGVGSDGAKGAVSINEAGGMVIAQTPESCKFKLMPVSVIKTGIADFVLDPREMSHIILQRVNIVLKNTNSTKAKYKRAEI